jgi:uncharacterized membrane-anchored protein
MAIAGRKTRIKGRPAPADTSQGAKRTMVTGLQDHPLRAALTAEAHARPFARLEAPERVAYLAMLSGEAGAADDLAHVAGLFERFGLAPPGPGATHAMADFGPFRFKWERHSEFSGYGFFRHGPRDGAPFSEGDGAIAPVPPDWLEGLPGACLVAVRIELLEAGGPELEADELAGLLSAENFAGSRVAGGAAEVWMDFAMDAAGYGRALVRDRSLGPAQAGRVVQRLCEIEAYRMMALLAFPLAKSASRDLSRMRDQLTPITDRLSEIAQLADERRLLAELTGISATVEKLATGTAYRFGATRAYYALVRRRIEELREQRIEGMQTLGEFMERRLAPAVRTCEAVAERTERLSTRVARASELLRTRVDIEVEAQNQKLLSSMERRARLQLRLQQTVEGLSVAAVSLKLVGLVAYLAKAAAGRGLPVDSDLVAGLAVPAVLLIVWLGVKRIRRLVTGAGGEAADKR